MSSFPVVSVGAKLRKVVAMIIAVTLPACNITSRAHKAPRSNSADARVSAAVGQTLSLTAVGLNFFDQVISTLAGLNGNDSQQKTVFGFLSNMTADLGVGVIHGVEGQPDAFEYEVMSHDPRGQIAPGVSVGYMVSGFFVKDKAIIDGVSLRLVQAIKTQGYHVFVASRDYNDKPLFDLDLSELEAFVKALNTAGTAVDIPKISGRLKLAMLAESIKVTGTKLVIDDGIIVTQIKTLVLESGPSGRDLDRIEIDATLINQSTVGTTSGELKFSGSSKGENLATIFKPVFTPRKTP